MIELLIIGIVIIIFGFVLKKILDSQGSRLANIALVVCEIIGIVCIGFFAGL